MNPFIVDLGKFGFGQSDGVTVSGLSPDQPCSLSCNGSGAELVRCLNKFQIKRLQISRFADVSPAEWLAVIRHDSIEQVSISSSQITDDELRAICELPRLTLVSLELPGHSSRAVRAISRHPGITHVSFHNCVVPDAECALIVNKPGLLGLSLSNCDCDSNKVLHGAECANLEILHWDESHLSIPAIEHLSSWHSIKDLSISRNELGDHAISLICRMRNIARLRAIDMGLTSACGPHLAAMDKMIDLWISDSTITDSILSDVMKLPALKRLDVSGCGLSPAGIDRLRRWAQLEELVV